MGRPKLPPEERRKRRLIQIQNYRLKKNKSLTKEQKIIEQLKRRVVNLTEEQVSRKRARDRVENLTQEQIARKRAKDRIENLSKEQLAKKRAKNRAKKLSNSLTHHTPKNSEQKKIEFIQNSLRNKQIKKEIDREWEEYKDSFYGYENTTPECSYVLPKPEDILTKIKQETDPDFDDSVQENVGVILEIEY